MRPYLSTRIFSNLAAQFLLHHKTHAVTGILQDDTGLMVSVMKLERAPMKPCGDIGGNPGNQGTKSQSTVGSLSCSETPIPIGSLRITFNAPRTVRGEGYHTAERGHSLRCPRHQQDTSYENRCKINSGYLPSCHGVRVRDHSIRRIVPARLDFLVTHSHNEPSIALWPLLFPFHCINGVLSVHQVPLCGAHRSGGRQGHGW